MTVNSTLAHSAIKSLKHAQECMIALGANSFLIASQSLTQHIQVLEHLIVDEIHAVNIVGEEIERGE